MTRDQARLALFAMARTISDMNEAARVSRLLERAAGSEPELRAALLEEGAVSILRTIRLERVA